MKSKQIATMIPEDALAEMDRLCDLEMLSRRKFMRRAVLEHIAAAGAAITEREAALALYRATKEVAE